MSEVFVRFYDGKIFSQRAKSRIYVRTDAWDNKNGRMVIPAKITPQTQDIRDMQNRLDQLETAIYQVWFNEQYDAGVGWLQSTIDDYLAIPKKMLRKTVPEIVREYMAKKKMEESTLKQYDSIACMLERYQRVMKRNLYADNFTPQQVDKVISWYSCEEVYTEDGHTKIVRRGRNTISAKLRKLSAACRWAVRNGFMPDSPFGREEDNKYHIEPEVYGAVNYLTKKERDHLYAFNKLTERQAVIRDIFIFQCHVGCRVEDLLLLTKDNITEDGFLQYVPTKTETENPKVVRVPLSDTAKEIIARYASNNKPLLPFTDAVQYNREMHIIARTAGLNRIVFVRNPITGKRETKEVWEICSSHMARRTFSQNIFRLTKDSVVTSSFTGHSPNTKAFLRYTEVDDEMKEELLQQAEKQ